jgi:hypothetical protein
MQHLTMKNWKKMLQNMDEKLIYKRMHCMDDKLHVEWKLEKNLHPMNEKYPFASRNHANVVSWQNLYLFLAKPRPFSKTFLFVG